MEWMRMDDVRVIDEERCIYRFIVAPAPMDRGPLVFQWASLVDEKESKLIFDFPYDEGWQLDFGWWQQFVVSRVEWRGNSCAPKKARQISLDEAMKARAIRASYHS